LIQKNSRVEFANGIKFYEQDLLYDDYIYSGSSTISVTLDYRNPGFGIAFIASTSSTLTNNNAVLLFRIRNKVLEIIYKQDNSQRVLATYNATYAKTVTENLVFKIDKNINSYDVSIGGQKLVTFECPYDMSYYYLGYYSNQDNVIKHINIASAVPYGWIVNMENTNGGYIDFYRDAFELKYCNGIAEIEQINISLEKGRYYLKYDSIDSDVVAYIMFSEDERVHDNEKNILKKDGSFEVPYDTQVNLKFKASKGMIKNITITTLKDNAYIRTSPDSVAAFVDISYMKLYMHSLQTFIFEGTITDVPGLDHYAPIDYCIFKHSDIRYGIYDLNLALNVPYMFTYDGARITITNMNNKFVSSIEIDITEEDLTIFENVNGILRNFVIVNNEGEAINLTIENTIKRYLPGAIKSPIVVVDSSTAIPLDLSASYRWYYENNEIHYLFTNTEREYFIPNHRIKVDSPILDKLNTVTVYGIKKQSRFDLDELLHIKHEGLDSIDYCADAYDILFEENIDDINKSTGEIRLNDIDDYKYIVVDYIKDNSYCINYRYHSNSYEIDIAVDEKTPINMYYDNIIQKVKTVGQIQEYINSKRYYNAGERPNINGYIVLGNSKTNINKYMKEDEK
jgi:hypothetical protein